MDVIVNVVRISCSEVIQSLQTFLIAPSFVLRRLKQLSGSITGESAKAVAEKKSMLDAKFVQLRREAIDSICWYVIGYAASVFHFVVFDV